MQTFKEYHIEEGKIGKALAMGALATSSVFGNFVQDWSDHYQTFGSSNKPALQAKAKENENRATAVLDAGYTVPADAKKAISIAAYIFGGDDGQIIIHDTKESVEKEIADEYIHNLQQVKDGEKDLEDVCFDLFVFPCEYDDENVIAIDPEGECLQTDHRKDYQNLN